jgi:hypothetical protein
MEITYTQEDIFTLIERDLQSRGLDTKDAYYRVSTIRRGYSNETTSVFAPVVTPIVDEAIQIELNVELGQIDRGYAFVSSTPFGGSGGFSGIGGITATN